MCNRGSICPPFPISIQHPSSLIGKRPHGLATTLRRPRPHELHACWEPETVPPPKIGHAASPLSRAWGPRMSIETLGGRIDACRQQRHRRTKGSLLSHHAADMQATEGMTAAGLAPHGVDSGLDYASKDGGKRGTRGRRAILVWKMTNWYHRSGKLVMGRHAPRLTRSTSWEDRQDGGVTPLHTSKRDPRVRQGRTRLIGRQTYTEIARWARTTARPVHLPSVVSSQSWPERDRGWAGESIRLAANWKKQSSSVRLDGT